MASIMNDTKNLKPKWSLIPHFLSLRKSQSSSSLNPQISPPVSFRLHYHWPHSLPLIPLLHSTKINILWIFLKILSEWSVFFKKNLNLMIIHSLQDSPKRVQWLPNALTISIKSLNMAHKNSDFWNLIILVFFLYSSITGVLWVLFVCVVQTLPLRTINACPWWNSIYVSIQLVIISRLQLRLSGYQLTSNLSHLSDKVRTFYYVHSDHHMSDFIGFLRSMIIFTWIFICLASLPVLFCYRKGHVSHESWAFEYLVPSQWLLGEF